MVNGLSLASTETNIYFLATLPSVFVPLLLFFSHNISIPSLIMIVVVVVVVGRAFSVDKNSHHDCLCVFVRNTRVCWVIAGDGGRQDSLTLKDMSKSVMTAQGHEAPPPVT